MFPTKAEKSFEQKVQFFKQTGIKLDTTAEEKEMSEKRRFLDENRKRLIENARAMDPQLAKQLYLGLLVSSDDLLYQHSELLK